MKIFKFLTVGLIWACLYPEGVSAQGKNEPVVVLTAKIKDMRAGQWVYYGPGSIAKRDSVSTTAGGFSLKINIPEGQGDIYKFGIGRNASGDVATTIYLEQGEVQMTGEHDNFKDIKLSGSKFAQDIGDAKTYANGLEAAKLAFLQKESLDGKLNNSDLEKGKAAYTAGMMAWIKQHPDAAYSTVYLFENQWRIPKDTLKVYFAALSPAAKNNIPGKSIEKKFSEEERLGVGKMAPDFTLADPSGKMVSLKDFRGKYVLLDFWASWCIFCRGEHPNLRKNYVQYEDRNLSIIGVSLDKAADKDKWLKAIKDDGLLWLQLVDFKAFNSDVARDYNITAIPKNFLIDPQGKIIGLNLRGEELTKKLEELLGDKS